MSQYNIASERQPVPSGGSIEIASLVLADIAERIRVGEERYGTKLMANNGRDALVDAYQEAIDLVFISDRQ